ncbi:cytochrome c-type biogenesis protein CcmH [Moraxella haemolytica]|uniref:cytochrome c-type biogenesis protein n=1 Tax=Moraxella TaxID=475 RepID=UPI002542989C|nr:cytochrome c-type biogenesis protein [Moraxella sp. ZY171148]WII95854.1 cytochrome c-type biogenesis protein CcmH [Moraxella sp. ZY171148]
MKKIILAVILAAAVGSAWADIDVLEFKTPEDETRYRALIEELRCPKCQNQNLASSDAPIALDLKQKTYQMISDGRSDAEIRGYMFERYGDFISYKPPIRPSTWILWFFPPILLILLVLGWVIKAKRQRNQVMNVSDEDIDTLNSQEEAELSRILNTHSTPNDKKGKS